VNGNIFPVKNIFGEKRLNYKIDINFDYRSEIAPKCDPDKCSPTLRKYHQILWAKHLPHGEVFTLIDSYPEGYLSRQSCFGEFKLSSHAITN